MNKLSFNKNEKIFIAGHKGMVGSALLRKFADEGCSNIVTKNRSELDLMNSIEVNNFFEKEKPNIVILAAAKVGGIKANIKQPYEFLYENLMIQNNVINSSFVYGVKKFVFIGSSCIYPKNSPQPIKEDCLLNGKLEPTNEGYAIAKISGLKLVEYLNKEYGFIGQSFMPCNLYGPNDSFDLEKSHVLSALVRKFIDAKDYGKSEVEIWGTGEARREFMHVNDLAEAVYYFINNYERIDLVNIGWGEDITIRELSELIKDSISYKGEIKFNTNYPDGMLRKCLDVTKMKEMNFTPKITLKEGINEMINIYNNIKRKKYDPINEKYLSI